MKELVVRKDEHVQEVYFAWPSITTYEDIHIVLQKMFQTKLLPAEWTYVPTEVPPPPCVPNVTVDGVNLKNEGLLLMQVGYEEDILRASVMNGQPKDQAKLELLCKLLGCA
eukprot:3254800-Karenia_brevis.AAC.1